MNKALKRLLCLSLVFVCIFSMTVPAFAASSTAKNVLGGTYGFTASGTKDFIFSKGKAQTATIKVTNNSLNVSDNLVVEVKTYTLGTFESKKITVAPKKSDTLTWTVPANKTGSMVIMVKPETSGSFAEIGCRTLCSYTVSYSGASIKLNSSCAK